jgi:hypothetical protein
MRKEVVVSYFKVPLRHLPRGTQEGHENLGQDSLSAGLDLNADLLNTTNVNGIYMKKGRGFGYVV